MGASRWPWALVAAGVAAEVPYPLLDRPARDRATVAAVTAFALAAVGHAAAWRGPRWAAGLVALAGGGGFAVEAAALRTGRPFGRYTYGAVPGPALAGVPLLVPAAWTMMAYPALLAGRRLARRRVGRAAVGAAALAAWDLFLDPQMVAAGYWRWDAGGPGLPGVAEVPLTNYAGWLAVAAALVAALDALPAASPGEADDRAMHAVYLWAYASSLLANLAFFRRPAVAAWGGLGMGAVAVPLARAVRRG